MISSVEKIKQCKDLDRAAADLKAAAAQRRELVTRLKAIEIDKLPDHAALGTSLTEAWQASATADDHYAAWAVQVKKPKYCKDGEAQRTKHTAQASRSSGEATAAKQKAARLWNGIAETYGLTKRQPTSCRRPVAVPVRPGPRAGQERASSRVRPTSTKPDFCATRRPLRTTWKVTSGFTIRG